MYIYERAFAGSVILVAINKNDSLASPIGGLLTALPAGTYTDYLGGLLGGSSITVTDGGGNNPVNNFSLPPHTVAVWTHSPGAATTPVLASVVTDSRGHVSNTVPFTILAAKLIPVTFIVNKATPTVPGDYIVLTGDTVEVGNWNTTWDAAVGPMLKPNYPNWFLNVSVPAGHTIQFKFIKITANGTVTWETGSNHSYMVPTSGTGSVNVNWQH